MGANKDQEPPESVEALLDTPNLANALESERFKQDAKPPDDERGPPA